MKYTKSQIINRLLNDPATKTDWEKSRKSFDDNNFERYCESVYDNSSEYDINEFMSHTENN